MFFTALGLTLASLVTATSIAPAQDKTNNSTKGTVTLTSKSVAVGVGVSWGDGILDYHGQNTSSASKGSTSWMWAVQGDRQGERLESGEAGGLQR